MSKNSVTRPPVPVFFPFDSRVLQQRLQRMGASRPPSTPPASKGERTPMSSTPGASSRAKEEEKIFVTVRVRPLSSKELAAKDKVAWECADGHTILYKGPTQDRAAPTSYAFGSFQFISQFHEQCCSSRKIRLQLIGVLMPPDKVFGPACQTDVVYEEGAKDVAMSALAGINGRLRPVSMLLAVVE